MRTGIQSLVALLAITAPAAAQFDVAIVASAHAQTSDCRFTDPQAKLLATGQFSSVDIINATIVTPTLADLLAYDAIITWSSFNYQNSPAFGDVLADYVDTGGGVVVAVFANSATDLSASIQGRWQMGYEVILDQSGEIAGHASLGIVHLPSHPIMAGVLTFDGGGESWRPAQTNLAPNATSIAEWDDGRVLVATGAQANRADLGFYPPSEDCNGQNGDYWLTSTDGALLMANALTYVSSGGRIGTNYCGPAVMNSSGQPGVMSASGSTAAAANEVTLACSGLPTNQFGYFLNSITQATTFPVPNSQGTLCLGGSIGRYNTNIFNTGSSGTGSLVLDLANTPTPTGTVSIVAGETWNWSCWYRDDNPGPTSNFTDGVSITFQ